MDLYKKRLSMRFNNVRMETIRLVAESYMRVACFFNVWTTI